ncbi:class I SAM-dependent methyltransferase [Acidiphilium acidophilum]|uniref:Class I SAM-dependent methyltransferase n=1 Tax=Acidiphilium acidophilum TaxID=76588 RepID=A0AAW9DSW5_ACIAO|nr:class I SAM-dependent methyltransferase [Acidiphilium acidophilum]MDX5932184.1 class I SAM-dependent methyltransferase [Acidiphilium acidophilum]
MTWGAGYVTDIAYAPGYYEEQSPRRMALTALVAGYAAAMPERGQDYHFVDIGCGQGFTALVLAAANPGWTVTGLDFNPAHIAQARALAAKAGVTNCRFIEADFTRFTGADLADFDAASLHGVWSWVAPEVRAGVVRLLADKLRPGGMCHVSYNVLPAWRGMLGVQRLVREAGSRKAARADRQAALGFEIVERLRAGGSGAIDPAAIRILDECAGKPAAYLAHEFMNEAWSPCFHQDVATALRGAKLDYVGSPRLIENFPALALDETALAIAAEFDDPAMVELLKDVTGAQPLRHDVFVRGAVRLSSAAQARALREMRLGLAVPHGRHSLGFDTPAGRASMSAALYEPVFAMLAARNATVGALLDTTRGEAEARGDEARGADNPAELVAMLVGTGQVVVVADEAALMDPICVRLNAAMFASVMEGRRLTDPVTLAVPALGGGLGLPGLAAFAVLRQHDWLSEATVGQALPPPTREVFAAWAELAVPGGDAALHDALIGGFETVFAERADVFNRLGLPC